ncbi:MAG: nuclear transport factor 2 family protein [Acidobacteria bacterium]|nr:nuclear transport factor 2 family protein [Acidobacteriota bacterium]
MATHSETIVRAYFDAIHDGRLDDLAALFAENASLHFPLTEPIVGREAIRQFYAGVFAFYTKRSDHTSRYFLSEDGGVAAEIHFEGTTSTGQDVVFDAVDVFDIGEGQIQKLQIFYDSARVLKMLGSLPNQ